MVNVTELRNGAVFTEDNQLLQVITYEHIKMGRGSGTIKLKVRNLKTGSVTEKSFITGARVNEASLEKKKTQFLYKDADNYYFMDSGTFEQFPLASQVVADEAKFLREGLEVVLLISDDQALGLELPNSIIYEVADTGPGEKGNSVSNIYKDATLDNGMQVKVPMFMKNGDKVKIDTRSGQYVERIK